MVVAAAADYFFDRRVKADACVVPVSAPSPSSAPRSAAARPTLAAELLDDGWSLVIFPEGGR